MNKFEKLMELLNEYDETEKINLYAREIEGKDIIGYNRFREDQETISVSKSVIISKRYGFIQRLVENDKIGKLPAILWNNTDVDVYYSKYEIIIMALSVSDTPIDDLIQLLK